MSGQFVTGAFTASAVAFFLWRARGGVEGAQARRVRRAGPRRGTIDPATLRAEPFDLPLRLAVRALCASDYEHRFLALLAQLTTTGRIERAFFEQRLAQCDVKSNTHIIVAEDRDTGAVLASGTVVIEPKFIHECGLVGHVEDVVVDSCMRRKGIGRRIVARLLTVAREAGAYKAILDCAEDNVGFYESCGFKRKEVMMIRYFAEDALDALGAALPAVLAPSAPWGAGLTARQVTEADYDGALLGLLGQLTTVGSIPRAYFNDRVAALGRGQYLVVIEQEGGGGGGGGGGGSASKVVAAGTLLVEAKFVHEAGLAGHIEDVVVDASVRGKGLGKKIISKLVDVARAAGCYKVVLDCSAANAGFYVKCGFAQKEVQMAHYFQ
jgi:glucosamine-phosphate N-acetyltransferase